MQLYLILLYLQIVKLQNNIRFPPYLAKNFDFKVKGNIHYIVRTNNYLWFCIYTATPDDYADKNIKIKTCLIH